MIVGSIPKVAGDDREVIFLVIGIVILAFTPLGDVSVVTGAHDRRPTGDAAAVTPVVFISRCGAVMGQADRVAGFVRRTLRHVFHAVGSEVLREYQRRLVVIADVIERADVGDATVVAEVTADRADQHAHAVIFIGRTAAGNGCLAHILSRHIDLERSVILGDTLPDLLDGGQFIGSEHRGAALEVERGTVYRLAGIILGIPCGAGKHVPVEIEINDLFGARSAVQKESLVQWIRDSRGDHTAFQCRRCLRQWERFIRIKQTSVPVHGQRVISPEQVGQFFNGLAVSLCDCRQMFPQRLDGLLSACGGRKGDRQDLSAATFIGLLGIGADAGGEVQKEDDDHGRSGSEYHGEPRSSTAPASHRELDRGLIL